MTLNTPRFKPFGQHLHNQIVIPLVLASVGVAVVATVVGVYLLETISEQWVEGGARQALRAAQTQIDDERAQLALRAKLIAKEPEIWAAITSGDSRALQSVVERFRVSTQVDHVTVVDSSGRVITAAGVAPTANGERALDDAQWSHASGGHRFVTLVETNGKTSLTAVEPVEFRGRRYAVVVDRAVSEEFLAAHFGGVASALVFVPAKGEPVAFIDLQGIRNSGSGQAENEALSLKTVFAKPTDAITKALRRSGAATVFGTGDQQHSILSAPVMGPSAGFSARDIALPDDPTGAKANIAVVVSNRVAVETGRTTMGLIAFWLVLGVLTLTGMATLLARRVSAPLAQLSDSARAVADGDFSSKVEISGSNEVAQLAESFNLMTASLRERTETLTKKVLELATLYEMSRSLGSTLELDTLLESVLDSALRIFDVDSGYVMLRDKNRGTLDLRAWRGSGPDRPDENAIRSSMSDWVVRQGRPLIFNPPSDDAPEQHVDTVTGALAALCVPLISGDGVIGAIAVGSRERTYRFTSDDVRLLSTIANHVTIAIGNIELFSSLQDAYLATVRSLAAAVDAKDPYTRGHSDKVASFARVIGEKLGVSAEQAIALEMAAYLHDIGKIGIKESILLKPGRLDDDEMAQMRHHPLIGANILRPVAFPWPIAPVVRHHHEHWDGGGYPAGLKGEEIPLLARVLSVADSFEAMTADRPYRRGRDTGEAIAELQRCQGTQFDPRVVDAMLEALESIDEEELARFVEPIEEVQPEEARAVFVAITDGMFDSFRRLGGPRLAANLEADLNAFLTRRELPLSISGGHIAADWPPEVPMVEQLDDMRSVLEHVTAAMATTTGRSVVEHFYNETLDDMSVRMRTLAEALELYARI